MTYSPDLQKFITYHRDNPQVFVLFEKFTQAAIARGHKRLSAWLIMNRVRWETTIETVAADGFKISNGLFAYYSRLYMHRHPNNIGFFRTKEMANETEITAWLMGQHGKEENNQAQACDAWCADCSGETGITPATEYQEED